MRTRSSQAHRALLALLVLGAVGATAGGVYGAFFATTSNPASALSVAAHSLPPVTTASTMPQAMSRAA